jgi:hypothetical protein
LTSAKIAVIAAALLVVKTKRMVTQSLKRGREVDQKTAKTKQNYQLLLTATLLHLQQRLSWKSGKMVLSLLDYRRLL